MSQVSTLSPLRGNGLPRAAVALLIVTAGSWAAPRAQAQLEGNLLLRPAPATLPITSTINRIHANSTNAHFDTGMGSLVTVGDPGWNVANIQIYQFGFPGNTWFGNVDEAILTVSRQVDGEPGAAHDPTELSMGADIVFSGIVPVWEDLRSGNYFRMQTDTSALLELQGLGAGDYVFSLTPFDDNRGLAFTVRTPNPEQDGFIRNTPGGFGWWWGNAAEDPTAWNNLRLQSSSTNPHEDWAIGINGTLAPEPSTLALAAILAGLAARRRPQRP